MTVESKAEAPAESPDGPEASGPKDDAPEETPVSAPEGPTDEGADPVPDVPDAPDERIAALQRQLDEAAPILQAHKDAEEARKTELQKATERAESLETELSKLRDEAARARVAEATGLTSEQVAHLKGGTEEELTAAATAFASGRSGLSTRSRPVVGAGASKGGPENADVTDPAALAAAIRKRMPY